jgi:hypothetical protein
MNTTAATIPDEVVESVSFEAKKPNRRCKKKGCERVKPRRSNLGKIGSITVMGDIFPTHAMSCQVEVLAGSSNEEDIVLCCCCWVSLVTESVRSNA